jgi:hypothetical protein
MASAKCKQFSGIRVAENSGHRFIEVCDRKIGRFAQRFLVTALDKNRAATRGPRAIDIPPPIAYDITLPGINVQLGGGAEDQARARLAAIARFAEALASVIANLNTIK